MQACLKVEVGWCLYRCFSSGGRNPCGGCERPKGSNEVLENDQFKKKKKKKYVNGKEKVMLRKRRALCSLKMYKSLQLKGFSFPFSNI